jgi:hypothetical protein
MSYIYTYDIQDTDKFHPGDYPHVVIELAKLNKGTLNVPVTHKADIIISYLKDHSLKNEWIKANPALSSLVTSNFFPTGHIESLFGSARRHKLFLFDFEVYIKKQFLN